MWYILSLSAETSTAIIVHDLFTYTQIGIGLVWAHKRAYATAKHSIKRPHIQRGAQTTNQWLIKMLFPSSIENHFFNYNQTSLFNLIWKVSFFFSRRPPSSQSSIAIVIWFVIIAIQFIKDLFVAYCSSLSFFQLLSCSLSSFLVSFDCVCVVFFPSSSFSRFRGLWVCM